MAIPDYQSLMLPVLSAMADGNEHQMKEIISSLIDKFEMTDDEKTQLLPSGAAHVFGSRVSWAKTYLKQAGLLISLRRGVFVISEAGRQLLATNPTNIDNNLLNDYQAFREFRERSRTPENEQTS